MFEHKVTKMIRDQGWKIARGPYFNSNLYAKKGVYVWSIKSVLSAADMKHRGIKIDAKNGKPHQQRTVRFVGEVSDGELISVRHLTTSGRKRLGRGRTKSSRNKGGQSGTQSGTSSQEVNP